MSRTCLVLMTAGLLVAGPAFAQADAEMQMQHQTETVTGTVVSISNSTLIIRTDSGTETFMIDARSDVPALRQDQSVTVTYYADPENADQMFVSRIDMDAPPAETAAESDPTIQRSTRTRLPQTATPLSWFAVVGLASLGGFLALGRKRGSR